MKKIMLIIVSVVMLFTACEKSSPQQIDPSEEFDDVIFGMTLEEVINAIDEDAEYVDEENEDIILYLDKTIFNINDALIYYLFDDYGKLHIISVYRSYSNYKQALNDYTALKETILKNYPPKTYNPRIYDYGEDDVLDYNTENRRIYLRLLDGKISLDISVAEQILSDDNDDTVGT